MHPDAISAALERYGVVDLAQLGTHPTRAAARHGLVLVQSGAGVAASQPIGAHQLMYATALAVPEPFAFLSEAALWAHGHGPLPETVEVGVVATRGISVRPPVIPRRLAPATLATIVVRQGLPVVSLEIAAVQIAGRTSDAQSLALVERLLRSRATTPSRVRDVCRRGLKGSRAVRSALVAVDGGDLELQKRRLRAALVAAGVTGLRSEVRLASAAGGSCYLDLPTQRSIDRRRDRWVRREHGVEVIRVADEEVRRDLPGLVVELLPQLGI